MLRVGAKCCRWAESGTCQFCQSYSSFLHDQHFATPTREIAHLTVYRNTRCPSISQSYEKHYNRPRLSQQHSFSSCSSQTARCFRPRVKPEFLRFSYSFTRVSKYYSSLWETNSPSQPIESTRDVTHFDPPQILQTDQTHPTLINAEENHEESLNNSLYMFLVSDANNSLLRLLPIISQCRT